MDHLKQFRVLLCEFHQESNTFNPIPAKLQDFYVDKIPMGAEGLAERRGHRCAIGGMADTLEKAGAQVIPTVFLCAGSGGRVEDHVLEYLCRTVDDHLQKVGKIDAVCVSLHGATCMVSQDDGCGAFLQYLRSRVGDIPIAASFDLHANITQTVQDNADILCGYQTYPHTDFYETGCRAASLCLRMLEGLPTKLVRVEMNMLLPPAGYSSLEEPFGALMGRAKEMVQNGTLLDFTLFPVQPWLDIPQIASTVVTIAADEETALRQANSLAQEFFDRREEYFPKLMPIDDVIDLAEANTTGKPVLLVDAADSPNGGAVGDSPAVALRLWERRSQLKAGMFVVDPAAAKEAFRLGVGGQGLFTIGAAFTPGLPGPLKAEGKVISLHDGYFRNEGPAKKGALNYIGPSAVVRIGQMDILLCQWAVSSGDPQLLRHFGIEPMLYDLIVVKANTSFKVPYGKITDLICYADTPGAGASNLRLLPWKCLPSGLYPLA